MGTKTIGLRDDVYDRLKARKRDDESFTDLVDRLLDESTAEWREGFGTLSTDETQELEALITESRERMGTGLASRQDEALAELAAMETEDDETA